VDPSDIWPSLEDVDEWRKHQAPAPMMSMLYQEIVTETEKAWLIKMKSGEAWFPKSQCKLDVTHKVIRVPDWLHNRIKKRIK
jgi:hypothetical protein